MANLQRMLGAMLASRMGGRGGMGGALGSAAMLGGLGGGGRGGRGRGGGLGSGLGGKAGLAALGYLAYRAYQNNQQAPERGGQRAEEARGGGGGPLGGLLNSITGGGQTGRTAGSGASLSERIGNVLNPRQDEPAPEDSSVSDNEALLLIRAMIAAANSDGQISPEERARIIAKLDEAGADDDDHRVIEKELRNPRPLDELLREVHDQETAQQFYLASRAAVEGTNDVQKSYLSFLRQRLNLPEADVAEIEQFAS